jgi:hypothetical protein
MCSWRWQWRNTTARFGLLLACLDLRPWTGSKLQPDRVASHDTWWYLQSIRGFCTLKQRYKAAIWIPHQRWNWDTLVYSEELKWIWAQHSAHMRLLERYKLFENIRTIWGSYPGRARVLRPKEISGFRRMCPVQQQSEWLWPCTKPLPHEIVQNFSYNMIRQPRQQLQHTDYYRKLICPIGATASLSKSKA